MAGQTFYRAAQCGVSKSKQTKMNKFSCDPKTQRGDTAIPTYTKRQQEHINSVVARATARAQAKIATQLESVIDDLRQQRDKLIAEKGDAIISDAIRKVCAEHPLRDHSVVVALLRPSVNILDGYVCVVNQHDGKQQMTDLGVPMKLSQLVDNFVSSHPWMLASTGGQNV
jgi:hypothetical protein